jgi:DNA ligase-1
VKAFTALYSELDQTTKTNEKVEAMVRYFSQTDPSNAVWALALLTGRRPKRPVRSSDLRLWASELAGIPQWLFEECYAVVGDLGETISLLVSVSSEGAERSLAEIMKEVINSASLNDEDKKSWLMGNWSSYERQENFIFNKLIAGSFRVGVSQQLVFKALSKTFSIEERTIAHRLMGNWDPQNADLHSLLLAPDEEDLSKPYPFYLAYQLDVQFSDLGEISLWQIERKYDGIRGQIISRSGEIHIWSRGEELMTEKFPEFAVLAADLPSGTVLDGEVLPFKEGRIMSFGEMQKRIGRKNVSKKILQEIPLCMMCYDILERNGDDIRQKPLHERRAILENLLEQHPTPLLKISPTLQCNDWNKLDHLRNESRTLGCEGLMLKRLDSIYETGRRRGKWWKWKVDPFTVDAVLIYAQAGHGRRANLYTDYTFAVWDKGELVPFAKAYSGLTDAELKEVDSWIKKNTLEKFGPVRSVKAELVFEIAFEGINASTRHKSGIALRFPRIARWRKDKRKEEINTKDDLLQLLGSV